MRKLKPKILVPQHTRPIEGEEEISEILTAYRDAIQLVHDQTVRFMNKGLYPDEITKKITLPPHLQNHPYLQEFYGTVEWSVKGVFCTYMGWFSGKASELHPMERQKHSKALVDLAGGPEQMEEKMKKAYDNEKFQWALELADAMLDTKNCVSSARVSYCQGMSDRRSSFGQRSQDDCDRKIQRSRSQKRDLFGDLCSNQQCYQFFKNL